MLAISPHLDDAIFSAGASLWTLRQRGWRVVVATVFTGNVERPSGFALACQLDKGLAPEVDYMALRREEDRHACAMLGVEARHLPLLEAPHRGYSNAAALFDGVLPGDRVHDEVRAQLSAVLADTKPDVVLAPLAIGSHVDHVVVRKSVEAMAGIQRLWLWEDWPYVDRSGLPDRATACRLGFSPEARTAKARACASYVSQLGFQFGGAKALDVRLSNQNEEWFAR